MADRRIVLLAHYDQETLDRCREDLESEGFRVQVAKSGPEALDKFASQTPDAVVLDSLLPRVNGLSVLKTIREGDARPGVPVLIMLDDGDTYSENRGRICGADGFVRRSGDGSLPEGALVAKLGSLLAERKVGIPPEPEPESTGDLHRLVTEAARNLRAENSVIAHITDSLTGLYNADYLKLKLAEEFKRARRFGVPLTAALVELRRADGEPRDADPDWRQSLNQVAGLLLCESRDIDILARLDASTFCLLLLHTAQRGAETMLERIVGAIEQRFSTDGDAPSVSAAAGIAVYAGEGLEGPDDLERRAQEALKQAWRAGGGSPVVWDASHREPHD